MAGLADFVTGFQRGRQNKYAREDREEARQARAEDRQAKALMGDLLFPGSGGGGQTAPAPSRVPLASMAAMAPLPNGQHATYRDSNTSSQFGPVQFGIGAQGPATSPAAMPTQAGSPAPAAGVPAPGGGAPAAPMGANDPRLAQLARINPQAALAVQQHRKALSDEEKAQARDRWGRMLGAIDVAPTPEIKQQFWEQLIGEVEKTGMQIPQHLRQFSDQGYQMAIRLWGDLDKSLDTRKKQADIEKTTLEADKLKREEVNPDNFKNEKDARQEFQNVTKDFRTVRDAATRIEASAKDPSAAGDLALIFNYMKVLDPGSTVREGEFATAQNSAGLPERLRAMYNSVINGERLAPAQRTDFLARSRKLFKAQQGQYAETEKQFRALAVRYGLNPDNVVLDYNPVEAVPEGNAPQPGMVEDGFRFKGGDPSVQENWEPVQ